jgi:glyoxylase I family protein
MSELEGLHHLSLSVRDLHASMVWYQDLLGFEKTFEREDTQQGWRKGGLRAPGNGMRLLFTEHFSSAGDTFDERRPGLDHVSFQVTGGRASLERWVTRLDEREIEHSGIKQGGSGDLIVFRDPDNIQLEFYATDD